MDYWPIEFFWRTWLFPPLFEFFPFEYASTVRNLLYFKLLCRTFSSGTSSQCSPEPLWATIAPTIPPTKPPRTIGHLIKKDPVLRVFWGDRSREVLGQKNPTLQRCRDENCWSYSESSVAKSTATPLVLFYVWRGNLYIASVLEIPADHKIVAPQQKT